MTDTETIGFDVNNWKTKLEHTKRKNKVKITFKLDKDESVGFEGFMGTVKPKDMDTEAFVKAIFFNGVEALNKEFSEVAKKYAQEQAGMLALDGVNPTETIEAAEEVLTDKEG